MARARNIKPGFFRNADLVELPVETRLLFIGLWGLADREGRMDDRPKQIKMEVYPADSFDVDAMLDQLNNAGFIERYEANGNKCIEIVNFTKHQNPHRDEKASTMPAPCKHHASTVAIVLNPESLLLNPESLIPEASIPPSVDESPEMFDTFWELWPATDRRTQKAKCKTNWKKHRLDAKASEILNHVAALNLSEKWLSGYEPAPLTYLNGRQWEDGLPTVFRQTPSQTTQKGQTRHEQLADKLADLTGSNRRNQTSDPGVIHGTAERLD